MMSVRPATWLSDTLASSHCRTFSADVLDAFYHALQSPEAAAVFSPSPGVCLFSADLGYRSRYPTASLQASFPIFIAGRFWFLFMA